jgi:glycosyltransferase involved in cell wall biosynthesis
MDVRDVTILLPTRDEELSIVATIAEINKFLPNVKIIVIDGLSTDRTVELARQFDNVSITNVIDKGKGIAVRKTIKFVDTKYVVMMDADFTYPAKHILEVLTQLDNGYDVVLGYRRYRQAQAMSCVNVVGNRALSFLSGTLYQKWVYDVCTGLWGFHRGVLDKFRLTSSGFTLEADLWTSAVKTGCRITQIPIEYRARLSGSVTKLKVSHGIEIGMFLIKSRFRK